MVLSWIDWLIIAAYLGLSFWIGAYYRERASKNLESFFLGGRNLPWYIAGISMVATTFAADTPLAVAGLVGKNGIAGNWLWWNFLMGGMLTTFFFARLWRRSGVVTEVELIELRYGGKPARFLRGFKAIYLGLFMNMMVMGWVNFALVKIFAIFFGIDNNTALLITAGLMVLTAVYSSLSGLLGVAMTDAVQFIIAMVSCVVLAVVVVNSDAIGGIDAMKAKLPAQTLEFFPSINNGGDMASALALSFGSFFAYVGIMWWSSWYPGQEPGGGGYVAQRMMSTKNEKHSLWATLFFQIGHYCIRPWPWILVGLCALILYPDLQGDAKGNGFVYAMRDFMPSGLRGLLLVAFLAAYMSTISTQLNWGASYLVNDFYKRFMRPNASDKMLVSASRIATILLMVVSLIVSMYIQSVESAWVFIMEAGAGLGLVLILRWYWWRINAWSEIAATVTPFIVFGIITFLKYIATIECTMCETPEEIAAHLATKPYLNFPNSFFITVGITTLVWVLVTFLTKPESKETLLKFYERVQPGGMWKPIAMQSSLEHKKSNAGMLWLCWLAGIGFTYGFLFFTGKLILHEWTEAGWFFIATAVSFVVLWWASKKGNVFGE